MYCDENLSFSLDSEQVVKQKHQTLINRRHKQNKNKENISKYQHRKQIPQDNARITPKKT